MISVTIWRKTLVRNAACSEGLAVFDSIAALQPLSDPRRLERISIARWSPLHAVWPAVAGAGPFARWLQDRGIIPDAYLAGAYLAGANLTCANLADANLSRANLRRAYLSRANLRRANLTCANLTGAYLSRADLIGANLTGADLTGADLTGADLIGANLTGADLTGAYRGATLAIEGWRTSAAGYLEREVL